MTLFEYIAVPVSIVLSLSAAKLLGAARHVFRPGARYWVHAAWVVEMLFVHVLVWWSIWSVREFTSWTMATFALVLMSPAVLYVASSALVTDSPEAVESWEAHFFEVRRAFFSAYLVLVLGGALRRAILATGPMFRPDEFFSFAYLLVGAWSADRRIQTGVVLCEFVAISIVIWTRFLPGVL